MPLRKDKKLVLIILLLNLLCSFCLANTVTSSQVINDCTVDCFLLELPDNNYIFDSNSFSNHIFFSDNEKIIYYTSNTTTTTSNGYLKVTDLRDLGGFQLSVTVSNFVDLNSSSSLISYADLGLLSFAENPIKSVDSESNDDPVVSQIDPVENGKALPSIKPFNYNYFRYNTPAPSTNFYTIPTGTDPDVSDPILVFDSLTTPSGGRIGEYKVGLGGFIKIPSESYNPPYNLQDDSYKLTLTFTLT